LASPLAQTSSSSACFDDKCEFPATRFPVTDTLTKAAVKNGAVIGSNSWGNDVQGEYDTDAAQFDEFGAGDADPSSPGRSGLTSWSFPPAMRARLADRSAVSGDRQEVIANPRLRKTAGNSGADYGLYARPARLYDGGFFLTTAAGPWRAWRIKPDLVAARHLRLRAHPQPRTKRPSPGPRLTIITSIWWQSMSGPHGGRRPPPFFVQCYKSTHTNAMRRPRWSRPPDQLGHELDELNGGPGLSQQPNEGLGPYHTHEHIVTNITTNPR